MMRVDRTRMRLLVMLIAMSSCSALSISHWDLEGANKTCDWKATCQQSSRGGKSSRAALREVDWRDRNCLCDSLCAEYGDCCPDSVHFEVSEQRRGLASYKCVELRNFGGIYMRHTCPPRWGDMDVRRGCELASSNHEDPMAGVPVTSNNTGTTYRNLYCAMCHDDHYDLHVWHPRMECNSLPPLSAANFSKLLQFDGKNWGVELNDMFHTCTIDPVVPESAMSFIRRCLPNVIRTCAINWTNIEVRSRCEAYTSVVYFGENIYRNPHCAVCNNSPLQYLSCSPVLLRNHFTKEFSLVAFSILFDLSGGQVGLTTLCGEHQLFDPFFKRCRSIITELNNTKDSYRIKNEETRLDFHPITHESSPVVKADKNCSKVYLERGEFQLENGSMWVSQYKKWFSSDEFEFREDGNVEICIGDLVVKLVNKFGIYMGYVTYAGLGVSIIFLLLHLTAFCLVEELRNLSGKNLASLCVALLVAYTAFMAGLVLEGSLCTIDGVITFYAFLASFFWTSTMSFDVWRTLRLATAELRVSSGRQWRKFFVYSVWSWCAPAVVVSGALWVEFTPANIDNSWRPAFGSYTCWFGHPRPLLAFFAAPVALIMFSNIVFFVSSARMIYSTTSTTKFTASATTQRDFRLYVRLSVVMGLAWTTGLIAATFNLEFLWYMFIALNTLQGLFIFLAFTCNDKVIRGLAVRRADDKPLRPPSFSWSTDSTARRSTSDTLY